MEHPKSKSTQPSPSPDAPDCIKGGASGRELGFVFCCYTIGQILLGQMSTRLGPIPNFWFGEPDADTIGVVLLVHQDTL